MSRSSLLFLRPYLYRGTQALAPQHVQAYLSVQRRFQQTVADAFTGPRDVEKQRRLDQLRSVKPLDDYHPRLVYPAGAEVLSLREFNARFADITETKTENVSVFGRIRSVRLAGSKLMFLDIERDTQRLQIMVERKKLNEDDSDDKFKSLKKVARIGDWVSAEGNPTRTSSGQLTILALKVPQVLAPCLHHIPHRVDNAETLARRPHIHSLTSAEPADVLRLRALVYDYIRTSLIQTGFLEVETPMFDVNGGGAIARPFETVANEMAHLPLRLRIAPELNLKRLIVGGQDRIFEMGRSFRNEGVDNTHNPEFSTCEFYQVGATLAQLIARTEDLVAGLHLAVEALRTTYFPTLAAPTDIDFTAPFAQLPFIPTIEQASGRTLPSLTSPTATADVQALFHDLGLALPSNPTLPRLLDALAEHYIEPLCHNPTFITHHPEALSPLSKSFVCPHTKQRVAARVELFIASREYVNAYEEENSPFEQRRKFMAQHHSHAEAHAEDNVKVNAEDNVKDNDNPPIDESYLEALEWGMPPTGGWGCGLDRLVMLFASKKRIADVLPFGTLRNVVSIAKTK